MADPPYRQSVLRLSDPGNTLSDLGNKPVVGDTHAGVARLAHPGSVGHLNAPNRRDPTGACAASAVEMKGGGNMSQTRSDIVSELVSDHQQVKHTFARMEQATAAKRAEMFWELTNELV